MMKIYSYNNGLLWLLMVALAPAVGVSVRREHQLRVHSQSSVSNWQKLQCMTRRQWTSLVSFLDVCFVVYPLDVCHVLWPVCRCGSPVRGAGGDWWPQEFTGAGGCGGENQQRQMHVQVSHPAHDPAHCYLQTRPGNFSYHPKLA